MEQRILEKAKKYLQLMLFRQYRILALLTTRLAGLRIRLLYDFLLVRTKKPSTTASTSLSEYRSRFPLETEEMDLGGEKSTTSYTVFKNGELTSNEHGSTEIYTKENLEKEKERQFSLDLVSENDESKNTAERIEITTLSGEEDRESSKEEKQTMSPDLVSEGNLTLDNDDNGSTEEKVESSSALEGIEMGSEKKLGITSISLISEGNEELESSHASEQTKIGSDTGDEPSSGSPFDSDKNEFTGKITSTSPSSSSETSYASENADMESEKEDDQSISFGLSSKSDETGFKYDMKLTSSSPISENSEKENTPREIETLYASENVVIESETKKDQSISSELPSVSDEKDFEEIINLTSSSSVSEDIKKEIILEETKTSYATVEGSESGDEQSVSFKLPSGSDTNDFEGQTTLISTTSNPTSDKKENIPEEIEISYASENVVIESDTKEDQSTSSGLPSHSDRKEFEETINLPSTSLAPEDIEKENSLKETMEGSSELISDSDENKFEGQTRLTSTSSVSARSENENTPEEKETSYISEDVIGSETEYDHTLSSELSSDNNKKDHAETASATHGDVKTKLGEAYSSTHLSLISQNGHVINEGKDEEVSSSLETTQNDFGKLDGQEVSGEGQVEKTISTTEENKLEVEVLKYSGSVFGSIYSTFSSTEINESEGHLQSISNTSFEQTHPEEENTDTLVFDETKLLSTGAEKTESHSSEVITSSILATYQHEDISTEIEDNLDFTLWFTETDISDSLLPVSATELSEEIEQITSEEKSESTIAIETETNHYEGVESTLIENKITQLNGFTDVNERKTTESTNEQENGMQERIIVSTAKHDTTEHSSQGNEPVSMFESTAEEESISNISNISTEYTSSIDEITADSSFEMHDGDMEDRSSVSEIIGTGTSTSQYISETSKEVTIEDVFEKETGTSTSEHTTETSKETNNEEGIKKDMIITTGVKAEDTEYRTQEEGTTTLEHISVIKIGEESHDRDGVETASALQSTNEQESTSNIQNISTEYKEYTVDQEITSFTNEKTETNKLVSEVDNGDMGDRSSVSGKRETGANTLEDLIRSSKDVTNEHAVEKDRIVTTGVEADDTSTQEGSQTSLEWITMSEMGEEPTLIDNRATQLKKFTNENELEETESTTVQAETNEEDITNTISKTQITYEHSTKATEPVSASEIITEENSTESKEIENSVSQELTSITNENTDVTVEAAELASEPEDQDKEAQGVEVKSETREADTGTSHTLIETSELEFSEHMKNEGEEQMNTSDTLTENSEFTNEIKTEASEYESVELTISKNETTQSTEPETEFNAEETGLISSSESASIETYTSYPQTISTESREMGETLVRKLTGFTEKNTEGRGTTLEVNSENELKGGKTVNIDIEDQSTIASSTDDNTGVEVSEITNLMDNRRTSDIEEVISEKVGNPEDFKDTSKQLIHEDIDMDIAEVEGVTTEKRINTSIILMQEGDLRTLFEFAKEIPWSEEMPIEGNTHTVSTKFTALITGFKQGLTRKYVTDTIEDIDEQTRNQIMSKIAMKETTEGIFFELTEELHRNESGTEKGKSGVSKSTEQSEEMLTREVSDYGNKPVNNDITQTIRGIGIDRAGSTEAWEDMMETSGEVEKTSREESEVTGGSDTTQSLEGYLTDESTLQLHGSQSESSTTTATVTEQHETENIKDEISEEFQSRKAIQFTEKSEMKDVFELTTGISAEEIKNTGENNNSVIESDEQVEKTKTVSQESIGTEEKKHVEESKISEILNVSPTKIFKAIGSEGKSAEEVNGLTMPELMSTTVLQESVSFTKIVEETRDELQDTEIAYSFEEHLPSTAQINEDTTDVAQNAFFNTSELKSSLNENSEESYAEEASVIPVSYHSSKLPTELENEKEGGHFETSKVSPVSTLSLENTSEKDENTRETKTTESSETKQLLGEHSTENMQEIEIGEKNEYTIQSGGGQLIEVGSINTYVGTVSEVEETKEPEENIELTSELGLDKTDFSSEGGTENDKLKPPEVSRPATDTSEFIKQEISKSVEEFQGTEVAVDVKGEGRSELKFSSTIIPEEFESKSEGEVSEVNTSAESSGKSNKSESSDIKKTTEEKHITENLGNVKYSIALKSELTSTETSQRLEHSQFTENSQFTYTIAGESSSLREQMEKIGTTKTESYIETASEFRSESSEQHVSEPGPRISESPSTESQSESNEALVTVQLSGNSGTGSLKVKSTEIFESTFISIENEVTEPSRGTSLQTTEKSSTTLEAEMQTAELSGSVQPSEPIGQVEIRETGSVTGESKSIYTLEPEANMSQALESEQQSGTMITFDFKETPGGLEVSESSEVTYSKNIDETESMSKVSDIDEISIGSESVTFELLASGKQSNLTEESETKDVSEESEVTERSKETSVRISEKSESLGMNKTTPELEAQTSATLRSQQQNESTTKYGISKTATKLEENTSELFTSLAESEYAEGSRMTETSEGFVVTEPSGRTSSGTAEAEGFEEEAKILETPQAEPETSEHKYVEKSGSTGTSEEINFTDFSKVNLDKKTEPEVKTPGSSIRKQQSEDNEINETSEEAKITELSESNETAVEVKHFEKYTEEREVFTGISRTSEKVDGVIASKKSQFDRSTEQSQVMGLSSTSTEKQSEIGESEFTEYARSSTILTEEEWIDEKDITRHDEMHTNESETFEVSRVSATPDFSSSVEYFTSSSINNVPYQDMKEISEIDEKTTISARSTNHGYSSGAPSALVSMEEATLGEEDLQHIVEGQKFTAIIRMPTENAMFTVHGELTSYFKGTSRNHEATDNRSETTETESRVMTDEDTESQGAESGIHSTEGLETLEKETTAISFHEGGDEIEETTIKSEETGLDETGIHTEREEQNLVSNEGQLVGEPTEINISEGNSKTEGSTISEERELEQTGIHTEQEEQYITSHEIPLSGGPEEPSVSESSGETKDSTVQSEEIQIKESESGEQFFSSNEGGGEAEKSTMGNEELISERTETETESENAASVSSEENDSTMTRFSEDIAESRKEPTESEESTLKGMVSDTEGNEELILERTEIDTESENLALDSSEESISLMVTSSSEDIAESRQEAIESEESTLKGIESNTEGREEASKDQMSSEFTDISSNANEYISEETNESEETSPSDEEGMSTENEGQSTGESTEKPPHKHIEESQNLSTEITEVTSELEARSDTEAHEFGRTSESNIEIQETKGIENISVSEATEENLLTVLSESNNSVEQDRTSDKHPEHHVTSEIEENTGSASEHLSKEESGTLTENMDAISSESESPNEAREGEGSSRTTSAILESSIEGEQFEGEEKNSGISPLEGYINRGESSKLTYYSELHISASHDETLVSANTIKEEVSKHKETEEEEQEITESEADLGHTLSQDNILVSTTKLEKQHLGFHTTACDYCQSNETHSSESKETEKAHTLEESEGEIGILSKLSEKVEMKTSNKIEEEVSGHTETKEEGQEITKSKLKLEHSSSQGDIVSTIELGKQQLGFHTTACDYCQSEREKGTSNKLSEKVEEKTIVSTEHKLFTTKIIEEHFTTEPEAHSVEEEYQVEEETEESSEIAHGKKHSLLSTESHDISMTKTEHILKTVPPSTVKEIEKEESVLAEKEDEGIETTTEENTRISIESEENKSSQKMLHISPPSSVKKTEGEEKEEIEKSERIHTGKYTQFITEGYAVVTTEIDKGPLERTEIQTSKAEKEKGEKFNSEDMEVEEQSSSVRSIGSEEDELTEKMLEILPPSSVSKTAEEESENEEIEESERIYSEKYTQPLTGSHASVTTEVEKGPIETTSETQTSRSEKEDEEEISSENEEVQEHSSSTPTSVIGSPMDETKLTEVSPAEETEKEEENPWVKETQLTSLFHYTHGHLLTVPSDSTAEEEGNKEEKGEGTKSKESQKALVIVVNNPKHGKVIKTILENIISTPLSEVDLHYIDMNSKEHENDSVISESQPLAIDIPYEKCDKTDFEKQNNCFCDIQHYLLILNRRINKGENIQSKSSYCESFLKLKSGIIMQNSVKPIQRKRRGLIYMNDLKQKEDTIFYHNLEELFDNDYKLKVTDNSLFYLPSETVRIPCMNSSLNQAGHKDILWTFSSPTAEKDELLAERGQELVLHGASVKNAGNYTCSLENKKDLPERKHWHELEMITFPIYHIKMNIFYKINDSCSLHVGDGLYSYLPKVVSPILCSNENEFCSIDMDRPRCLTREDDNYFNVTITAKTTSEFVLSLREHCDINCKLKAYENVVYIIYRNSEILEHIPVYSDLDGMSQITFIPRINGKEGSTIRTKPPTIIVSCPAGFGLESKSQSVCVVCPPHTFSSDDEAFCKTCPGGQYQPDPGSKSCIQCNSPVDDKMCLRMLYTDTKLFKIYVGVGFGCVVLLIIVIIMWSSGYQADKNLESRHYEGSLRHRAGLKKKDMDLEKGANEPLLGSYRVPPQPPPIDF